MADRIKIVFASAEAMITSLKAGKERVQDTTSEMLKIAGMMEDGALVGSAGTTFVDAIRDQLVVSLGKLDEMIEELAKDVGDAVKTMQEEDQGAAGNF